MRVRFFPLTICKNTNTCFFLMKPSDVRWSFDSAQLMLKGSTVSSWIGGF